MAIYNFISYLEIHQLFHVSFWHHCLVWNTPSSVINKRQLVFNVFAIFAIQNV
jgi:hypothetical protein